MATVLEDECWLVALDIDGTLVSHDGVLTDGVRSAVRAVREAGHEVVLASGRSLVGTLDVVHRLEIDHAWVVASNGALTAWIDSTLPGGYRVEDVVTFDPGPVLRVLRPEVPEAYVAVEKIGVGSLVSQTFPEGELVGEQHVVDFDALCAEPVTRVVVRSTSRTREHLTEITDRLDLSEVSYFVGWTAWLDIVPQGVTKASALDRLRGLLKVPLERTLAVGDGSNDVPMLQWSARGVVMGQAAEHVRACGDEVTLSVEHDGVVPVLQSLPR